MVSVRLVRNTGASFGVGAGHPLLVVLTSVAVIAVVAVLLARTRIGRTGELVNCTIKRVEGPDYILDLGKTEAKLPKKEQSRLESYSVGDRVRCVIRLVDKSSKGPGVLVSRAAPELVMRLFEQEVPGDLRWHGGDQGLRARGRRTHQDRGAEPRPRRG